jgi:hypothetical protein
VDIASKPGAGVSGGLVDTAAGGERQPVMLDRDLYQGDVCRFPQRPLTAPGWPLVRDRPPGILGARGLQARSRELMLERMMLVDALRGSRSNPVT